MDLSKWSFFQKVQQKWKKFRSREDDGGLLPFTFVKYMAFTIMLLMLVSSLLLSWVISNNAKGVLLKRSEAYSRLFTSNLNRQVFFLFVLPTMVREGGISMSDPKQYNRLDEIVRRITRGMRIESISIYDSQENRITYSTVEELRGKENMGGLEYQRAVQGESTSVLISSGTLFNLLPGAPEIFCTLKTSVPFRQSSRKGGQGGEIMGVIEVTQNLSDDLRAIILLQGRIILVSLLVMGVLFTILTMLVMQANRIMDKRATDRLRFEEKINESQRLASLGKMIATVSHEIKNPLGIVRATAEILAKRIAKVAPEDERLANIIIEETSRLDTIVRDFLDFARPREIIREEVNVNDILTRVLDFMEPEFSKRQVVLVKDYGEDLPCVAVDSEQMYQVFFNIVFNALQAMPDGGTVTVISQQDIEEGQVHVAISDTGQGISAEKIEQIFNPFYTDKLRGTGLGLAIVKNIVDKHEGRIDLRSVQGQGSTFTVILPLVMQDQPLQIAQSSTK